MRISDWSSDVCSSDLPLPYIALDRPRADRAPAPDAPSRPASLPLESPLSAPRLTLFLILGHWTIQEVGQYQPSDGMNHGLTYWCDKIGRASCRERVCKYV